MKSLFKPSTYFQNIKTKFPFLAGFPSLKLPLSNKRHDILRFADNKVTKFLW